MKNLSKVAVIGSSDQGYEITKDIVGKIKLGKESSIILVPHICAGYIYEDLLEKGKKVHPILNNQIIEPQSIYVGMENPTDLLDSNYYGLRRKLGIEKQFFQSGRAISAPELEMLSLLVEEFGSSNVVHQSKKFGYYYDFLINDEVLVEYDGYYYHKVLINKNDAIKERLALTNGYSFVRVEEDENRKADLIEGIKRIKNELQTKENKEY